MSSHGLRHSSQTRINSSGWAILTPPVPRTTNALRFLEFSTALLPPSSVRSTAKTSAAKSLTSARKSSFISRTSSLSM